MLTITTTTDNTTTSTPKQTVIEYTDSQDQFGQCALEEYFKANPKEKFVLLYCGCQKCSPFC